MERVLEEVRRYAWLYGRLAEISQDMLLYPQDKQNIGFRHGLIQAHVDAASDMLELAEWIEGA